MTILNGAAYVGCLKSLETLISVASLHHHYACKIIAGNEGNCLAKIA